MNKRNMIIITVILIILLAVMLTACVAGSNTARNIPSDKGSVAGFWRGLWHGIIAPVTFIISLFNDNITIYEVHNSGRGYDFGFVLGSGILFSLFGGGTASARRRRSY